tara:strand:+ start:2131 stop:2655 length:525 start_codon:yes stop_codon:yes gene_type:complete
MLPVKTTTTHSRWSEYEQLNTLANNIRAGHTLTDLKGLGFDVKTTKNIEVLTYLDVAKRFGLLGLRDPNLKIPAGVQRMVDAAEKGRGYELTVESTLVKREGSFWKDFLNFKQVKRTTGWKFSVLIITVDDKVEYVLHKGNPNINRLEIEKNPLGPFQKLNGYVLVDLAEEFIE